MAASSIPEVEVIVVAPTDSRLARRDGPIDRVSYEQTFSVGSEPDGPVYVVVPPGALDDSLDRAAERFRIDVQTLVAFRARLQDAVGGACAS